jgi:hypothetical protein
MQTSAMLPQQLPQLAQQSYMLGSLGNLGDASWQAQAMPSQEIMGLVDSMSDQARKAKSLQLALLQAQAEDQQLRSMVMAESLKSRTTDDSARKLAMQAEESFSLQKAKLDELTKKFTELKSRADADHMQLISEHTQNQEMNGQLAQARATIAGWQQKAAVANRRAQDAEAREMNAVKAGELEDMALSQQEGLLKQARDTIAAQSTIAAQRQRQAVATSSRSDADTSTWGFQPTQPNQFLGRP